VDSSSAEYTITVSVDNSLSAVTAIDSSNIANLVAMLTSVSGGNSAEAPLTLCSRPGDEQRRLERHILRGIEGRGQVRGALNLYACTADGHSEGGGLYAGKTVDPNREDTDEDRIAGKGYIVSLALPSRPQASRNDGA
jgi:hypothetical protein